MQVTGLSTAADLFPAAERASCQPGQGDGRRGGSTPPIAKKVRLVLQLQSIY